MRSHLSLAYSVAAASLRLKNAPALRIASAIAVMVFLAGTLLSSDHVSRISLAWACLLALANVFQIVLILWELRPVRLQGERRMLRDLIFPNLSASDFNRLMRFAEWRSGDPGEVLASQGSEVTEIIVLLKGSADVERDGRHVRPLSAGAIIGEIGYLSAQPFSSTIRLSEHSRLVAWSKSVLDDFFACHPSIASSFDRAFIARLDPAAAALTRSVSEFPPAEQGE
jgi:CRP-like cAMP-binding protein